MVEATPVAAPTVPSPSTKATTKKRKKPASSSKAWQPMGPSVAQLITKAVLASKERKGLSLAALRKVLASGGYNVDKINIHIKLGLKRLVSKGTLVQRKGTGTSSSFKMSKKLGETKEKAMKKKLAAKAKKPKKAAAVKKSPKKVKKPAATVAKIAAKSLKKEAKSPKKAAKAGHPKKAAKSLAKVKAVKPKADKPKAAKPIAAKAKNAAPKKK